MQWRTHDGRGMGKGDEGGNKGGDDGKKIAGDEKHTCRDGVGNIGDEGIMQDGMIGRMWRDDASVGGHNKHWYQHLQSRLVEHCLLKQYLF